MTHRELCIIAAKYLRTNGIYPFHRCKYSVVELERIGECPDAFGWGGVSTQLIEVKISRADFLSDWKKEWRRYPENGLGQFRSYLCPEGIIKESDIPDKWGLLWIDGNGNIIVRLTPDKQQSSHGAEIQLITSIMRREGIKPQTFSYKNYTQKEIPL